MRLAQIDWDGVFKTGKVWQLTDAAGNEVRTWYFAPKWWVRISCLLHGWGWPSEA